MSLYSLFAAFCFLRMNILFDKPLIHDFVHFSGQAHHGDKVHF
jgi:hypothetical protein